jgi:predicted HAD superfamily Cof-like phosphohydrolase
MPKRSLSMYGGKNMQRLVKDFHYKFGCTVNRTPQISHDWPLRYRLMSEELHEFHGACESQNLVEAVDAIGDILYVTLGTAVAFGVEIRPIFDEIHRTNMQKEPGNIRADGKIMKPEGWQPPDIAKILKQQNITNGRKHLGNLK